MSRALSRVRYPWAFHVARYRYRRDHAWGGTNRLVVGAFAALLGLAVVSILVGGR